MSIHDENDGHDGSKLHQKAKVSSMKPLQQALRARLMTGSRLQPPPPPPRVYRTEPGHQKTPNLLLMSNKAQSSILSLSKWLKQKADNLLRELGSPFPSFRRRHPTKRPRQKNTTLQIPSNKPQRPFLLLPKSLKQKVDKFLHELDTPSLLFCHGHPMQRSRRKNTPSSLSSSLSPSYFI